MERPFGYNSILGLVAPAVFAESFGKIKPFEVANRNTELLFEKIEHSKGSYKKQEN